jgi:riboflavin kinase/FMN adenylyltransferase
MIERWRGIDQIPPGWGRCIVTIGVFDGVHLGHQALIRAAVAEGRQRGLPTVVMTFDPHPASVVRQGQHPALLSTLRRRAELVAELGADVFLVLPFTPEVSAIPAESFVHDILVDRLHAACVVVGRNVRVGHQAAGRVQLLEELGPRFGVTTVGVGQVGADHLTVSST